MAQSYIYVFWQESTSNRHVWLCIELLCNGENPL